MTDIPLQAVDAAVTREVGSPAPQRLSKRFVFALVLLYLGAYVPAVGVAIVAWPIVVARLEPGDKVFWLSIVTGLYALVNVIATPIAGTLSDRCVSRFGMRRPFIVVGVAFAAVGLTVMEFSASIGLLLVGVVLHGIGNATITGAANALVPDQVPAAQRGRIQGVIMVCIVISGVLAAVILPMLLNNQLALFAGPAVVMVIAAVVVCVVIRDRRLTADERAEIQTRPSFVREFRIDPRTVPDYSWAWVGKLIVVLATVLTSTFGVYVLTDQLGVSQADLPGVLTLSGLVGLFTAILGAVGGSYLSDHFQKRKSAVLVTAIIMAVGAVIVAFSTGVPMYLVGLAILGVGSGAYSPIDGALFIDVLPGKGKESGKYMSLMTVADQIPRSFGPILGSAVIALSAIIAIGGYQLIYLVGAVVGILGALTVRRIKGSI